jgi:hypothetical protein
MGLGVILGVIGAVIGVGSGALGMINPLNREFNYYLNTKWPNQEIDLDSAIDLYFRGLMPYSTLKDVALKYGYTEGRLNSLIDSRKRLLSAEEYVSAWLRGYLTDNEVTAKLKALGLDNVEQVLKLKMAKRVFSINEAFYLWRMGKLTREELGYVLKANGVSEADFDKYEMLTAYMPSPTDIIRFAVREVFTPEIVEKYKMLEDIPPQYLDMAKKLGIPEDVAKWYWAAHWELPSLTLGIEMFHRKIITREELITLMRTLDIMPGWRDKLIELSYVLPTRVDVRRMYEIGVITRDQLKEYYEKMGYSPEDAERLTQWTVIEYAQYDRDLTVNQIIELYRMGEFTREEAKNYLMKLGYPPEVADYKLTLAEHEEFLKNAKEDMAALKEMFLAGVIDYDTFYSEMLKLPFSPNTIRKEVVRTVRQKQAQTKLPTKVELKRWLKLGIIDVEDFKQYLKLMGYRDIDVERYVLEVQNTPSLSDITE